MGHLSKARQSLRTVLQASGSLPTMLVLMIGLSWTIVAHGAVGRPTGVGTATTLSGLTSAARAQGAGISGAETLDQLLNEAHPSSSDLLRTGIALAQNGQYPEAVRAFTRCVHEYPALFEGYYNLALAELAQDHFPQALADIDRAPHRSKAESTARTYLRGKIEAGMGQKTAALRDLSAAFQSDPKQENYALDLGLEYLKEHAYIDSERVFGQGSAENPRSSFLALGLALAQFLGGRTRESIEASRRVLAAEPGFSPARLLLGFALYMDGKLPETRQVAGEGLKLPDPDPYLYYLEAVTMIKQHRQEDAQILGDLDAAERGVPNCALCYVASGKVREKQNQLREALSDLQKAIRLAPELSEGWYHLAVVYDRLGDTADASAARSHFQALKENANEREKDMLRGALLESLGAGR
jgi:tetratricopeptide (TPR) repeat protein